MHRTDIHVLTCISSYDTVIFRKVISMRNEKPIIIVRPNGRMGNQMFQLMLALELSKKLDNAPVYGYSLPDWNISAVQLPALRHLPDQMFMISKNKFNLNNLLALVKKQYLNGIVIEGWGMRLEYYGEPERYRKLFCSSVEPHHISRHEILINIRAEDIVSGFHPHYFPMSFSFFEQVISSTGLTPVFMGQIATDKYSLALKERFKDCRFLPSSSPIIDFLTIRSAHHVALSISSFSWLAAWLSETAKTIHMPLAGLFLPTINDVNLVPRYDRRYRFYKVPFPAMHERKNLDIVEWANSSSPTHEVFFKL